ncbi:hypothetical protein [uncultured Shewanella sp.]|uniref:hypothetical protein n=1 Tax=uncultured Shewanella sp. TaxID=173975 RepID=UPI0026052481|nr:hypothetical protein [uncultured Shewanella sp.]
MKGNNNPNVTYSKDDIFGVLKTINLLVVSLNSIAMESVDNPKINLANEILTFLQENNMLDRLSSIREVLSEAFDTTLGDDDMDELERAMEDIEYWSAPND